MAKKRIAVESYSPAYLKLFELAAEEKVTLTLESKRQAENLRNELYACRSRIYESPLHQDLADAAQNVRFRLEENKLIAEPIRIKNK